MYPNFYIVGAPKCGTTSLFAYLGEHPEVYVPDQKEPHYLATDLDRTRQIDSEKDYLALFSKGDGYVRIGEGSTMYLYSQAATDAIYRNCSSAKIMIMIRQPVDMMYSLFYHNQFKMLEGQTDFCKALELEASRAMGKNIPEINIRSPFNLRYRYLADFAPHIQRYYQKFGKQNVHVIVYDDLKRDIDQVYEETLNFLEIDTTFQPIFERHNVNKVVKNTSAQSYLMGSSNTFRQTIIKMIPRTLRISVKQRLLQMNQIVGGRPALDAQLRKDLTHSMRDKINQVEDILNRDLSQWYGD